MYVVLAFISYYFYLFTIILPYKISQVCFAAYLYNYGASTEKTDKRNNICSYVNFSNSWLDTCNACTVYTVLVYKLS